MANVNPSTDPSYQQVIADLNSGNFSGAFKEAAQYSPAAPSGGDGSGHGNRDGDVASTSNNPLAQALLTSQGLQSLDPSLQWNPTSISNYYAAAMDPTTWTHYVGNDPYSSSIPSNSYGSAVGVNPDNYQAWGSDAPGQAAQDAAANLKAMGTNYTAPNLGQYAGEKKSDNLLETATPYVFQALMDAGIGVATAGAGLPAAIAIGAGEGAAGAEVNGVQNGGSGASASQLGKGALTGAVTGAAGNLSQPVSSSLSGGIQSATGLGSTAANAIAAGLVKGGIGAGVGALGGALSPSGSVSGGAIRGGIAGAASGAVGSATGSQLAGTASGILGSTLAGKYLTSPTPAAPAPVAAKPVAPVINKPVAPVVQTPPPAPTVKPAPMPPATTTAPANIGSYSGYGGATNSGTTGLGYAPYTQTGPVANPYTYAQGPEQAMFVSANGPA